MKAESYQEYPTARDHFVPLASRLKKSSMMLDVLKMTAHMVVDNTDVKVPAERTHLGLPAMS